MANSFVLYTGNGSTTQFSIAGIDGWITSGFLKVYLNDVLQTTGYTLIDLTTATPKVQFTSAPATGVVIRVQRETPATVASFKSNVVDFNDGSILTAADLDKVVEGLLHVAQEAEDTGSGAIGKTLDQTSWNAESLKITNLAPGSGNNDAVNFLQLQTASLYGGAATVPQAWSLTGNGGTTYTLSPAPLNTAEEMFVVDIAGAVQRPSTYTITDNEIIFGTGVASAQAITVRNFGVSRSLNESVTTAMLQNSAVTTAKIADLNVTTGKVENASSTSTGITDAKLRHSSALSVIGRSANNVGAPADIIATPSSGAVLRESGGAVGFGTIATAGISDDAVTADKLRDDASTDSNRAVTTNHIRNGAITSAKLDTDLSVSGTLGVGSNLNVTGTASSTTASATTVEAQNLSLNAGYGSLAPVFGCRAWVNFNGTAASNLSGTYSQSGTTVTVTATAHGLLQNSQVYVDITSGTAVDGIYTVATVAGPNTFTYTAATSLTTSGNCNLIRNTIRGSGNVSSIADNSTGDYTVNFATALPDTNYCGVITSGVSAGTQGTIAIEHCAAGPAFSRTTASFRVQALNLSSFALADSFSMNVAIFR